MGLAEQRQKQRIGEDPQNTNWSKDSNRFGFKMLEKMGWTSGKGLGANEDGTLQHVKAAVKKNQHGLGFDAKTSDNWIENTSGFAQVLAKLNSIANNTTTASEEEGHSDEAGSPKAKKEKKVKKNKKEKKDKRSKEEQEGTKKRKSSDFSSDSPTDKKLKHSQEEPEEVTVKVKKSKKNKKEKKDKKDKKSDSDSEVAPAPAPAARLSHRARYLQNKKLSTSDPSVLSAIFGIRH